MTSKEADALIATIRQFVAAEPIKDDKRHVLAQATNGSKLVRPLPAEPSEPSRPMELGDKEKLFEQFKTWLLKDLDVDPVFVKLLANVPEMEVQFTSNKVTLTDDTMRGRVARLMAQGWFDTTRTVGGCRTELKRTGPDPGGGGTLGQILNQFVTDKFLVRDGDGFTLAPRVKITEKAMVSE